LRPRVRELTARLLAAVPTDVPVDLVATFTFRLPITVLCELLGLPLEDRDKIHEWTTALVLDDRDRTVPSSDALADYLDRQIARVRAKPDDGLLSGLVHASVDGDALTADELMAQLFLLVVSGHETTSGLIANTMYALLVRPGRWRALVADPTLARAALDETLRYDPPVRNATHRVTLEAVEFGGTTVPAGQILMISLSAAGRAPGTTDDAAEFDLHRKVRHHVAFGHGPHHCPGQQLALLQAETALTALATGFPNTRLLDASPPRSQSSILSGIAALTLVLA
ncbi:cytochrome P450, partial [Lentzea sp.]|uniref:cytochrome P450 n=1 Tax=Lentzea sp. TaxID=56099 RepID=UPI002ED4F8D0